MFKKSKKKQSTKISTSFFYFEKLPQDLKIDIIKYLPLDDQLRFSQANKHCELLVNNPSIWKNNFSSYFYNYKNPSFSNKKEIYEIVHSFYRTLVKNMYSYLKDHFNFGQKISEYTEYFEYDADLIGNEADEDFSISSFITMLKNIINKFVHSSSFNQDIINLTELFHQFLHYYPNVNEKYGYGFTLLHIAAALPSYETVNYLIKEKAACQTIENNYTKTSLKTAILFCKMFEMDLADLILNNQENSNNEIALVNETIMRYKNTIETFLNCNNSNSHYIMDAKKYAEEIQCKAANLLFDQLIQNLNNLEIVPENKHLQPNR
jgi:hypothetical protein